MIIQLIKEIQRNATKRIQRLDVVYVLLNKYPSKDSSSSNNIIKYDRHNNIVEVFPKANLLNKYSSCDLLLPIEFNN